MQSERHSTWVVAVDRLTGLEPASGTAVIGACLRDPSTYPDLTRLLLVVSLTLASNKPGKADNDILAFELNSLWRTYSVEGV